MLKRTFEITNISVKIALFKVYLLFLYEEKTMARLVSTTFICFALFFTLFAQNHLDGIAAVVDDEVILNSELDAYTMLRLGSLGLKSDSVDLQKHRITFLNELIDGKILLVHGKLDSTISVTDEEVESALTSHITNLLQQNNLTLDSLEVELNRQQGLTLAKFKADARKAIREQLIKQKVQQSYLFTNKINRKDVEGFFNEYKDSLPPVGESVLLSKLSIKISASKKIRQTAYDKITSLKTRLENGEDFAELAKNNSDGPEGAEGGDLGFIAKGTLNDLAFEEIAFGLSAGQISEPFESKYGFHILSVLERRDQKVHTRQIFIKVEPPASQIAQLTAKLDSLRGVCTTKEHFMQAVKQYSDDPSSKAKNGSLGWIAVLELPAEIKSIVDSITIGSISYPLREKSFISIYRLDKKVANRTLSMDNDYTILSEKAMDVLAQKKLLSLVAQWRNTIFIDIRI